MKLQWPLFALALGKPSTTGETVPGDEVERLLRSKDTGAVYDIGLRTDLSAALSGSTLMGEGK